MFVLFFGLLYSHKVKFMANLFSHLSVVPYVNLIYRIADWNDVYGDGVFSFNVAYPYVATINTISQSVAMYCLVLFYRATKV